MYFLSNQRKNLDWDNSAFKNVNSRHSPYRNSEIFNDL